MAVKRATIDQVVLCMHLDKGQSACGRAQHLIHIGGFKAHAHAHRQCNGAQPFWALNSLS